MLLHSKYKRVFPIFLWWMIPAFQECSNNLIERNARSFIKNKKKWRHLRRLTITTYTSFTSSTVSISSRHYFSAFVMHFIQVTCDSFLSSIQHYFTECVIRNEELFQVQFQLHYDKHSQHYDFERQEKHNKNVGNHNVLYRPVRFIN